MARVPKPSEKPARLGLYDSVTLPGAPRRSEDLKLRALFATVEEQRNMALAAVGELTAELAVVQDQYKNHVLKLEMENGQLHAQIKRLRTEASSKETT